MFPATQDLRGGYAPPQIFDPAGRLRPPADLRSCGEATPPRRMGEGGFEDVVPRSPQYEVNGGGIAPQPFGPPSFPPLTLYVPNSV